MPVLFSPAPLPSSASPSFTTLSPSPGLCMQAQASGNAAAAAQAIAQAIAQVNGATLGDLLMDFARGLQACRSLLFVIPGSLFIAGGSYRSPLEGGFRPLEGGFRPCHRNTAYGLSHIACPLPSPLRPTLQGSASSQAMDSTPSPDLDTPTPAWTPCSLPSGQRLFPSHGFGPRPSSGCWRRLRLSEPGGWG